MGGTIAASLTLDGFLIDRPSDQATTTDSVVSARGGIIPRTHQDTILTASRLRRLVRDNGNIAISTSRQRSMIEHTDTAVDSIPITSHQVEHRPAPRCAADGELMLAGGRMVEAVSEAFDDNSVFALSEASTLPPSYSSLFGQM